MSLRSLLAALFRQPKVVMAEIAWRWLFGVSALALAGTAFLRVARAMVVFPEEQEMLASRSPILVAQAILEIGHRIRPVAVRLGMVVIPAILLLWILAATVGRGYVLTRLSSNDLARPRWLALTTLNTFRVVTVLLLTIAYFGCTFATSLVIDPYRPNYALGILVFLLLFAIALASWSIIHWIVATACIYASRQNLGVFPAVRATMQLLRENFSELFSIAAQNSSVRTAVAILFTLLAMPPLLFYRVPLLFWTFEIVLSLAYCAVSDILLLARLAAYIELAERAPAVAAAEQG